MCQDLLEHTPATRKRNSLPKLVGFVRNFTNWREVWSAYRNRLPLPPFQVRGGPTLIHGQNDDPLYAFQEIFERREYSGNGDFYQGHVVVDIGANNGFFAMFLHWLAPGIRIHCFEPGREAFGRLCANIAANGCKENVTAYPFAIADCIATKSLRKRANSMLRSLALDGDETGDGQAVAAITLDRAFELCGEQKINLLKMDIEGGEVEVVRGSDPETWRPVEKAVAEIHESLRPGSARIVEDALRNAGFRSFDKIRSASNDGCLILRAGR
jgi:FkbM family methyltransferase